MSTNTGYHVKVEPHFSMNFLSQL